MTVSTGTVAAPDAARSGSGPLVLVQDVHRHYGSGARRFHAVRGVSFEVMPGELFALLGTNGAGKTSTVELIEGLARPSGGRIRLFDGLDPVKDRARIRPRTGVMLQQGGFVGHLTVRETLRLGAALTTAARPVDEALELVGLGGRADVAVQNLSGGERRRLDLALATLGRPDLLFLDEPTAGMDPEGRHATWELIRGLRERGCTIILTTHYLEEAETLADQVAILHRGRLEVCGTLAQVVARHPSTVSFRLPEGRTAADLPISGRSTTVARDGRVTVTTDDLQGDATTLLSWAQRQGIVLAGLTARPASLEEAFIAVATAQRPDDDSSDERTQEVAL